jgi:hypothetical protein
VGGLTVDVSLYSILMFTIVGFVGIAGISLLVGRFPDPYVYFAVVGAFLLAFVTFPVTLMNQSGPYLPEPVKILIGGLFLLSYILSFFEFYKGGSL